MDPNQTLKQLLEMAMEIKVRRGRRTEYEESFSEKILALNEWILNGGFLPNKWNSEFCQRARSVEES